MAAVRYQPQQQQQQQPANLRDVQVRHLASLTSGFGQLTPDEGLQRLRQMESSGGGSGGTHCRLRLLGNGGGVQVLDSASGQVMEEFPLRSLRQPLAYEGGRDNLLMFSVQSESGSLEMHIFQLPGSLQASQFAKEMHELILQAGSGGGDAQDSTQLVQVLNRCLEEVEAFAVRLQQQQLQQQRPGTPRSHRSSHRSPPPSQQQQPRMAQPGTNEFVDILKKLKLALNLLGRLEDRIHQPNAPELVHCLFIPLGLIVQEAVNTDLASRVLSPLLTPAAVALLKHCLTSSECELWYSLGSAWTCHRQRWIDEHRQQAVDVPPYRPRFNRDGWQPELEPELLGQGLSKSPAEAPVSNGGVMLRQQQPPRETAGPIIKVINPAVSVSQQRSRSPYGHNGSNGLRLVQQQPQRPIAQVAPRGPLAAPPQKIYAPLPQQSQSARRSFNDGAAAVGVNLDDRQERLKYEAESRGHRVVQALHDKAGRNAKELTVQRGEFLEVLDDSRNWWQLRNYVGEVGHVPYTILRVL